MFRSLFLSAVLALIAITSSAHAGPVLDRIRSQKVIRCGAKPRPGLVSVEKDGRASGLLLDLCRAIGAGVLGLDGRIEFTQYDSAKAFDAVRNGTDDIFFLDGSDVLENPGVADKILPGPAVFFVRTAVMVGDLSPVQHLADLAGKPICVSQGSNAHRQLEGWFAAHHLEFQRMAYQEDVELLDTYNAQVCPAIAAEETTLGDMRQDTGVNHLRSRILPEPLATFPVLASTSLQDPEWFATVAWSIYSLMGAEVPHAPWRSGGIAGLPLAAPSLQLDEAWQSRILKAAGTYGAMFEHNLGGGSPLRLSRGPNALVDDGGLSAVPRID